MFSRFPKPNCLNLIVGQFKLKWTWSKMDILKWSPAVIRTRLPTNWFDISTLWVALQTIKTETDPLRKSDRWVINYGSFYMTHQLLSRLLQFYPNGIFWPIQVNFGPSRVTFGPGQFILRSDEFLKISRFSPQFPKILKKKIQMKNDSFLTDSKFRTWKTRIEEN